MEFLSFLTNPTFYILLGVVLILRSLSLLCYRTLNNLNDDEELHVMRIDDPRLGIPMIRRLIREAGSHLGLGQRTRRMSVYLVEEPILLLNLRSDTIFPYGSGPESRVKNLDCGVCLEEFEEGEECRLLPDCEHGYHRACIDKWLERKRLCPLCRTPIDSLVSDSRSDIESRPLGSLQFVPSVF